MPSHRNRFPSAYCYFDLLFMLSYIEIIGVMKTQARLLCKSYKFSQFTTLQSLHNLSIDTIAFQPPSQHFLNPYLIQIQIADSTKSPSPPSPPGPKHPHIHPVSSRSPPHDFPKIIPLLPNTPTFPLAASGYTRL
jgi:hypothetical protein